MGISPAALRSQSSVRDRDLEDGAEACRATVTSTSDDGQHVVVQVRTYDARGRRLALRQTGARGPHAEARRYDQSGNLVAILVDGHSTARYRYDGEGRRSSGLRAILAQEYIGDPTLCSQNLTANPPSREVVRYERLAYRYDLGHLVRVDAYERRADAERLTQSTVFHWNGDRLAEIERVFPKGGGTRSAYVLDSAGRIAERRDIDSFGSCEPTAARTSASRTDGRLTRIETTSPATPCYSGSQSATDIRYDPRGRLVFAREMRTTAEFSYDEHDRLVHTAKREDGSLGWSTDVHYGAGCSAPIDELTPAARLEASLLPAAVLASLDFEGPVTSWWVID